MGDLRLNPDLDTDSLARNLHRNGRIQIHDFLEPASAEYIHRLLDENRTWYLSFNRGAENMEVPLENLTNAPDDARREFIGRVHSRAERQFQYLFVQYYITETIQRGEDEGHPLHEIHHFLNSDAALEFFRSLTGEPAAHDLDVMASRYEPGHFLARHDDSHGSRDRIAAYVLNLTRDWNPDWGGHLAFFEDSGNISEAYVPSFNTLNVFTVPQLHAVQAVAPFAGGVRTSLTGWVHRQ